MIDDIKFEDINWFGFNPEGFIKIVELENASHSMSNGISPIFNKLHMNSRWPDVKAFPDAPDPDGYIQFTLCPIVKMTDNKWWSFPALEFWGNRKGNPRLNTGQLINNWHNWAYWVPPVKSFNPVVDGIMGFVLLAGDRRMMDVGDVRERTNTIRVKLVANGTCVRLGPETVADPPIEPPIKPPTDINKTILDTLLTYNEVLMNLLKAISAQGDKISILSDNLDSQRGILEEISNKLDNTIEGRVFGANLVLRRTDRL